MEMNKHKFIKFMVDEIERHQKEMYKTNEGKKLISVLIEIYTLVSNGKFDVYREDVSDEINRVHAQYKDYKAGVVHHKGVGE
jgi:hypothetical protein